MPNKPITSLGVTLPELMTTVCVSGFLAAVAVPGFKDIITSNRTTSIANQLVTALNYTRSEAVKRGLQVTIRHKGAEESVWEDGWDIFTDSNGDGTMNDADVLLHTYDSLPKGHTLRTGGTYIQWMAYLPNGRSDGAKLGHDTFRLCDSSKDIKRSRAIIINRVGRVRTQVGTEKCP
jgi:type IV fimbrial biogenesis protein FimT